MGLILGSGEGGRQSVRTANGRFLLPTWLGTCRPVGCGTRGGSRLPDGEERLRRRGTHLDEWKVLLFINSFVQKRFCLNDTLYDLEISSRTAVDWAMFCCEVTLHWFENQPSIGGQDVEVEIDETAIARRKYNRGRSKKTVWVFGRVERKSSKRFMVPLLTDCPEGEEPEDVSRFASNLIPLVQ